MVKLSEVVCVVFCGGSEEYGDKVTFWRDGGRGTCCWNVG